MKAFGGDISPYSFIFRFLRLFYSALYLTSGVHLHRSVIGLRFTALGGTSVALSLAKRVHLHDLEESETSTTGSGNLLKIVTFSCELLWKYNDCDFKLTNK